jgi:hypothetical protein
MPDAIPFDEFDRKAAKQLASTVKVLRDLADRLERLPKAALVEALPVAAWGAEDLERRLVPWLGAKGR